MPSPFVGMDPFLEDPAIFPDLHDSFVSYLRELLNAHLPPPYFSGLASRIWVEASQRWVGPDVDVLKDHGDWSSPPTSGTAGLAVADLTATEPVVVHAPDDEIREPFVEVYADSGGERLVAVIEVLSLSNKSRGEYGRDLYQRKQREVLASQVHLVEIDLLRGGTHTSAVPLASARRRVGYFDYHVCVHRFDRRDEYFIYALPLGTRLPVVEVPLLPGDGNVNVDLQAVFDRCYEVGLYARRVKYAERTLVPPLSPAQAQWTQEVLRTKGLVSESA